MWLRQSRNNSIVRRQRCQNYLIGIAEMQSQQFWLTRQAPKQFQGSFQQIHSYKISCKSTSQITIFDSQIIFDCLWFSGSPYFNGPFKKKNYFLLLNFQGAFTNHVCTQGQVGARWSEKRVVYYIKRANQGCMW